MTRKMDAEAAEEYTSALGQVVSGAWRQIALGDRLGVPDVLGLSTREWVEQRLGGYVRLSLLERREAVRELAEEGMTQRQIGDVLGVGAGTVNRDVSVGTDDALDDQKQGDRVPTETRIAELPDDLADRVREGMDLAEAEGVVHDRERRIAAYVKRVRDALDLFDRMVDHPIPGDLKTALSTDENGALRDLIGALTERRHRGRRSAA